MSNKIVYIARDLLEKGEDFVVAKVVGTEGSTPRKKGAWLLMRKDGTRYGTVGGGKLEAESEKLALAAFETKTSALHHFKLKPEDQQGLDMRCGGDTDIQIDYIDASHAENFVEDFGLAATAYIFGGGHVGLALEPVLRHINFATVIIDDRVDFANAERFSESETIVIENFGNAYEGIETDENSYIIIVTRGHAGDYDVLKQTLAKPHAYIGMIGSRGKVAEVYKMLREDGFSQEQLDKVYSPIGLSIHAETPEEIAVSIAAEMIQVRAGFGK